MKLRLPNFDREHYETLLFWLRLASSSTLVYAIHALVEYNAKPLELLIRIYFSRSHTIFLNA